MPPVWSDLVARHRRSAPSGSARRRPASTPRRTSVSSGRSRRPTARSCPATILRHRDTPLDGTAPCLLYAYGAYESVYPDQEWDPAIPLAARPRRGLRARARPRRWRGRPALVAGRPDGAQAAHVRRPRRGRRRPRRHAGLVDGARIATRGLSAGGLLQGAVFSQRPDRWRAVVAEVPFVDVLTTMLDPTIPLTVNEWDEWGDPSRPEDYAWMARYSPYDNLPPAGGRPDLLVTGAVHDARVMVWEPAKWVGRAPRERPRVGPALPVPRRDRRRRPRRPRRPVRPPGLRGRDLRLAPRQAREPAPARLGGLLTRRISNG